MLLLARSLYSPRPFNSLLPSASLFATPFFPCVAYSLLTCSSLFASCHLSSILCRTCIYWEGCLNTEMLAELVEKVVENCGWRAGELEEGVVRLMGGWRTRGGA